jgi:hypothetical protein
MFKYKFLQIKIDYKKLPIVVNKLHCQSGLQISLIKITILYLTGEFWRSKCPAKVFVSSMEPFKTR